MPMSANVVCNNILRRAFEERISVSPMKLQKLMYFVSCEYAKQTGSELFSESFGVWQYGPVLPAVYDEFKSFKSSPINKYATDADGEAYAINEATSPNLRVSIERVWHAFKNYDGIYLSQITHRDNSGWSRAFYEHRPQINFSDMISDHTYEEFLHA